MCLAVEVKSGMLYYDGEPSLGRLSCKYIAIPVNLAVSIVYMYLLECGISARGFNKA